MVSDTLGTKIRKYRLRAKMSQMELELAIGASFGSISRIESGKVNPTKETLQKIADILKLSSYETITLFSIETNYYIDILKNASKFLQIRDTRELFQKSANVISGELGFVGVMIDTIEGGYLVNQAFADKWYTNIFIKILGGPYNTLRFKLGDEKFSKILNDVILGKEPIVFHHLKDMLCPTFSIKVANMFEKISDFKSGICLPIKSKNSDCIGIIYFGKDYYDDFSEEMEVLKTYTEAVGIAVENAWEYVKLHKKLGRK